MGKKRTLAIILLLCVLGGLIACGRKEKEDEYTYMIKLNDNASGSKQFSSCGYLWVYSVTDQMFRYRAAQAAYAAIRVPKQTGMAANADHDRWCAGQLSAGTLYLFYDSFPLG